MPSRSWTYGAYPPPDRYSRSQQAAHELRANLKGDSVKDPRCLVRWHKYIPHHAPDTEGWYFECSRCGKQKDTDLFVPPYFYPN